MKNEKRLLTTRQSGLEIKPSLWNFDSIVLPGTGTPEHQLRESSLVVTDLDHEILYAEHPYITVHRHPFLEDLGQ